jgi:hypothetical protein
MCDDGPRKIERPIVVPRCFAREPVRCARHRSVQILRTNHLSPSFSIRSRPRRATFSGSCMLHAVVPAGRETAGSNVTPNSHCSSSCNLYTRLFIQYNGECFFLWLLNNHRFDLSKEAVVILVVNLAFSSGRKVERFESTTAILRENHHQRLRFFLSLSCYAQLNSKRLTTLLLKLYTYRVKLLPKLRPSPPKKAMPFRLISTSFCR